MILDSGIRWENMMIGTVKFFNESKGYGFITLKDNNQSDYFFHISNVASDYTLPKKGDMVTFDVEHNGNKVSATNVSLKNEHNENVKFFIISNTRIKLNNIKSYGIGHTKRDYNYHYALVPEDENAGFLKRLFFSNKKINERLSLCDSKNSKEYNGYNEYDEVKSITTAYFYVTTFQGDNFKFFDDLSNVRSFENIGEKYAKQQASRLDSILNKNM